MALKWKLRVLMADRKISNKELAKQMGVHRNTIHQLKFETPKMIRFKHLESLCSVLQCTPSDLFELE